MNKSVQEHFEHIYSKDRNQQGTSFKQLMTITDESVDWAYQVWDDLIKLLENGDNRQRSIAGQLLCNLAKSNPDGRMAKTLPKLLEATKDEWFVTARHSLMALWRVGVVNPTLTKKTVDGLNNRFEECVDEKNCTLIRYDIYRMMRNIFDYTDDEMILEKAIALINTETDEKYGKKYLKVWKDILKNE